jgi:hypothetical protein
MKVEMDIITSLAESLLGRTVILVILCAEILNTDIIII